jgi:hypothetical protein
MMKREIKMALKECKKRSDESRSRYYSCMKGYGKMLEERNKDDRKINQNIQSM